MAIRGQTPYSGYSPIPYTLTSDLFQKHGRSRPKDAESTENSTESDSEGEEEGDSSSQEERHSEASQGAEDQPRCDEGLSIEFATPPKEVHDAVLRAFDEAMSGVRDVKQVDRAVMKNILWTEKLVLPAFFTTEDGEHLAEMR